GGRPVDVGSPGRRAGPRRPRRGRHAATDRRHVPRAGASLGHRRAAGRRRPHDPSHRTAPGPYRRPMVARRRPRGAHMTTSVTPRASFVLADNPGIMTLDGTNTWILREPGASRAVVVDPGPDLAEHLDAVVT